ncbi:hypothetical protein B0H13DRAFT_1930245 [Mycena leptocephala]|nr:hypothetical protein B0H13DRAFT_1930245 [Mycena leptocephala]
MSSNYSLLVQHADGITWKPGRFHSKKTKFYVVVHRDSVKIHRTPAAGGAPAPKWDKFCVIPSDPETSVLSLRIYHESRLRDTCVGEATTSVATLADLCGTEGDAKGLGNYYTDSVPMNFVGMDGSSKGKAMGRLFVILMKDREAATFAVDKSKKDMQTITLGAATPAISAGEAVDQTVTFGNTVQSALDSDEAQAMPIVNTVDSK